MESKKDKKTPYEAPKLVVHGDVEKLTLQTGTRKHWHGGGGSGS